MKTEHVEASQTSGHEQTPAICRDLSVAAFTLLWHHPPAAHSSWPLTPEVLWVYLQFLASGQHSRAESWTSWRQINYQQTSKLLKVKYWSWHLTRLFRNRADGSVSTFRLVSFFRHDEFHILHFMFFQHVNKCHLVLLVFEHFKPNLITVQPNRWTTRFWTYYKFT